MPRGRSPVAATATTATTAATTATVATAKATIPKALREQVWITYAGPVFQNKCIVPWCSNTMTVFDFHVGHNVPESQGGATDITNLRPICARCNLSMGSQYSITEWSQLSAPVVPIAPSCFCGFFRQRK